MQTTTLTWSYDDLPRTPQTLCVFNRITPNHTQSKIIINLNITLTFTYCHFHIALQIAWIGYCVSTSNTASIESRVIGRTDRSGRGYRIRMCRQRSVWPLTMYLADLLIAKLWITVALACLVAKIVCWHISVWLRMCRQRSFWPLTMYFRNVRVPKRRNGHKKTDVVVCKKAKQTRKNGQTATLTDMQKRPNGHV